MKLSWNMYIIYYVYYILYIMEGSMFVCYIAGENMAISSRYLESCNIL